MSAAELGARPEATIAAIVHGWFEYRSNGYADADIFREIEGRRAKAYGEEPLPGDLNLDSYTRYRMRLEYPGETPLHDPVYVMQAVHLVSEVIGREYGPRGEAPGLRFWHWRSSSRWAPSAMWGAQAGGGLRSSWLSSSKRTWDGSSVPAWKLKADPHGWP